jgi:hypothetical protein
VWVRVVGIKPRGGRQHVYHSRFSPEGVAETSQLFLRGTNILPHLSSSIDPRSVSRHEATLVSNWMGDQKIYYLELLSASEGTLSVGPG